MPPHPSIAPVPCAHCGALVQKAPSHLRASTRPFCTTACWYTYRRQYTLDHWWDRVDKNGDCWLCTGAKSKFGYGKIAGGGKYAGWIFAHRRAWEEASGEVIPDGRRVLHVCDVPACVRNDEPGVYILNGVAYPRFGHLYLATPAVNNADTTAKQRHASRLTAANVLWARQRYGDGEASVTQIASDLGVHRQTIYFAISRRTWRHLD